MQTFKDVTFGSVAEQKRFERILMYTVFIDVSIHVEKNNSQTLAEAPTYLRTWSLHTSTKAIHAHGSCHRLPPTPLHTRLGKCACMPENSGFPKLYTYCNSHVNNRRGLYTFEG